jgi:hypothetical protein
MRTALFAVGGAILGILASIGIYAAAQPAEHAATTPQVSYGSR